MKKILLSLLILITGYLAGCKVNVEQAKPYVEKDFGKVSFLHQEEATGAYEAFWYVHDLDTVIKTWHNEGGWDITHSEYRSLEVWDQYPRLAAKLKALRFKAGNYGKDTTEKDDVDTTFTNWADDWENW